MTNTDRIVEFLEAHPQGVCDDCLSGRLAISPRQQVNSICRRLQGEKVVLRGNGRCAFCGKIKLINVLPQRLAGAHRAAVPEAEAVKPVEPARAEPVPDIEEERSQILRFCRELWKAKCHGEAPTGAGVISALRDQGIVPSHPANMMRTLCALRNCYTYEQLALGPAELAVVRGAWAIVERWASGAYGEMWRETTRQR